MSAERRTDVGAAVVAAVLMVIAVAALWQSAGFSSLGALFPRAIGVALLVSSAWALRRALAGSGRSRLALAPDGLLRSGLLVLVMAAWIWQLETAGFVPASIVAFILLALIANRDPFTVRRAAVLALASVVFVIAFERLFVQLLRVQLPLGTLGWW